ncbi:MAG: NfeD family protein [Planctomycetaceae bacterium]|nr:hypothetical protein [Planctomycetaceae bacterium]
MAIALLALAAALIIAEVFIPSGGMLSVGMFISLITSFYFAWQTWGESNFTAFLGFAGFALLFMPTALIGALAILPRTRFGKRIFLEAPTEADIRPFAREEERLNRLVGKQARTITPLNPGGMITIDRERIHAFSEGVVIERDTLVQIIKVAGTRVLVRELQDIPGQPAAAASPPPARKNQSEQAEPLDFDLPDVDK